MRSPGRRRTWLILGALAAAGAAATLLWYRSRTPADPYVTHLEERIDALLPAVEQELGAEIPGPLRVAVATRRELGAQQARAVRARLEAIEGEPPTDIDEYGQWTTLGTLGAVDEDGTILICREELEGTPLEGVLGLLNLHEATRNHRGPEALDRVLVHELVHVFQKRVLEIDTFLNGSRHRSDLLARQAVAEGHAEVVTEQVLGTSVHSEETPGDAVSGTPGLATMYLVFDVTSSAWCTVLRYVQGRIFVESAIRRLGRDEAVSRLLAEPPSLRQIEHPETWPGPRAPDTGSDAMLRRMRGWLATDFEETSCNPVPIMGFVHLLSTADPATREAAAAVLIEVQRIEASGPAHDHHVSGYLLSANDEAGAATLQDAWEAAARARDDVIPENPRWRMGRVFDRSWSEVEIDGRSALLATRTYRRSDFVYEHAIVVRRGRHVLELRLVEDPGGAEAARRLARRLLSCVVDAPCQGDASARDWESRWRFASDPRSPAEAVRPLLSDSDPDVRHASLTSLLRCGELSAVERDVAREDNDPLVRLTALTWSAPDEKPDIDDLLTAVRDADPWVAAGGCIAANSSFQISEIPTQELGELLRRRDLEVRRHAACLVGSSACASRPGDDPLALVRLALSDHDASVRERAGEALLFMPTETEGLAQTFIEILTGDDDMLIDDAMRYLSIREPVPGTAEALTPYLKIDQHCHDAVETLAKLGDEAQAIVPELRRMAAEAERSGDFPERILMLRAIGAIERDRTELSTVIRAALETGTDEDAKSAAYAMEDLGSSGAEFVPTLIHRLNTDDRFLKLAILGALKQLGTSAESARLDIKPLKESNDPAIRDAAKRAIQAIRGRAKQRRRRRR